MKSDLTAVANKRKDLENALLLLLRNRAETSNRVRSLLVVSDYNLFSLIKTFIRDISYQKIETDSSYFEITDSSEIPATLEFMLGHKQHEGSQPAVCRIRTECYLGSEITLSSFFDLIIQVD